MTHSSQKTLILISQSACLGFCGTFDEKQ